MFMDNAGRFPERHGGGLELPFPLFLLSLPFAWVDAVRDDLPIVGASVSGLCKTHVGEAA